MGLAKPLFKIGEIVEYPFNRGIITSVKYSDDWNDYVYTMRNQGLYGSGESSINPESVVRKVSFK